MSEWLKEAVLKTVVPQGTGGSNPPCSEMVKKCQKIPLVVYMAINSQKYGGFEPERSGKNSRRSLAKRMLAQDAPESAEAGVEARNRMLRAGTPNPPCSETEKKPKKSFG